jgi:L-seryl-tRNA(Ser) seleniumtransferase
LVEIGGSFRIPDIMRQGGVKLKAVGATNRTRLDDYARAIVPDRTGGLLKVHSSNFRIIGYAGQTSAVELAGLARENNLPLVYDLGSGALIDLQPLGFHDEPTVPLALKEGADLVCFSGDKLLGGPQAGLIVGRKNHIDKLKSHPLARALRVDKMTLAALEPVLRLYLEPEEAKRNIPVLAMLFATDEDLRGRAEQLRLILAEAAPHLTFSAVPAESQTGGGAAPEKPLPSWAVAVEGPNVSEVRLEEYLRLNEPPIVARTSQGRLLLDVRTIRPDQYPIIAKAFKMFAYSAWPAGS